MAYVRKLENELGQAAESFRSGPFDVAARVSKQVAELRERDKEIAKLKEKKEKASLEEIDRVLNHESGLKGVLQQGSNGH